VEKRFKPVFVANYRQNGDYLGIPEEIQAGNYDGYGRWSFVGFSTDVGREIDASTTLARLKLRLYVTEPSQNLNIGLHKLATDPKVDGLPSYNALLNYTFSTTSPGWVTLDITDYQVSGTSYTGKTAIRDGGFLGVVIYGGSDKQKFKACGLTNDELQFEIIVEGTWSDTPASPTILTPEVGDVITTNNLYISWESGDPNRVYRYQVAFDYGTGWQYSPWLDYGIYSYNWDITDVPETSRARVGVKASNNPGVNDSPWSYVEYFTIDKNEPPSKPSSLSPNFLEPINNKEVKRFSWVHNDDDFQAGYQIRWKLQGEATWYYVPTELDFMNSTNQYHDFAPNTFPVSTIEWQVRTMDQQGLISDWSDLATAKAQEPTKAPIITSPVDGGIVGSGTVTISWSSVSQEQYEAILINKATGETIKTWSGSVAKSVKYDQLQNGMEYEVRVRVYSGGLWSDYSTITFTVQYAPPKTPQITRIENHEGYTTIYYLAGEKNLLEPLTTSDKWINAVNAEGVEVPPLSIDGEYAMTLDAFPYSGKRFVLEYPEADGKTFRAMADYENFGGRLFISFSPDGVDYTGSANYNTTDSSTVGTQSWQLTAPTGTNYVRVNYYATQDNSNIVPVKNLRLYDTPSITLKLDLYRRTVGETEWELIEENLLFDGENERFVIDYTPASGVAYEYKLVAIGDNSISAHSEPVISINTFRYAYIQPVSNLTDMFAITGLDSRSEKYSRDKEYFNFYGRNYPVVEFGTYEEKTIEISWYADTWQEVEKFRKYVAANEILLFRDNVGRRYFVSTEDFTISDRMPTGFNLSLTFRVVEGEG
jgi:hypothetical protein